MVELKWDDRTLTAYLNVFHYAYTHFSTKESMLNLITYLYFHAALSLSAYLFSI